MVHKTAPSTLLLDRKPTPRTLSHLTQQHEQSQATHLRLANPPATTCLTAQANGQVGNLCGRRCHPLPRPGRGRLLAAALPPHTSFCGPRHSRTLLSVLPLASTHALPSSAMGSLMGAHSMHVICGCRGPQAGGG